MTFRNMAVASVVALLASACAGASDEPVVVDVWFHAGQGAERDALDAQVRAFNATHRDVQIDVSLRAEGDYDDVVRAAAEDDALPCLLDLDGPYLADYVERGWLQPLDGLLDADMVSDVLPSIDAQGTVGGVRYAVGTFDSGLALWGNRQHLDAAGIRIPDDGGDAWTFEEFGDALDRLQALPQVEHALDVRADYGGEWFTYGFLPFVWGFGGDVIDRDGRASGTLDSAETTAALAWLGDLVDDGKIVPAGAAAEAFAGRRTAALSWVGHWMWEPYRSQLGDDLVLLPAPHLPAGRATGMGSWQWGITAGCDEPEAAATFLSFLLEPTEILRMTESNGAVPARAAAIERSVTYGPGGPLRVFVEQLETIARPRPVTPRYAELTTTFADVVARTLDGEAPAPLLRSAATALDGGSG